MKHLWIGLLFATLPLGCGASSSAPPATASDGEGPTTRAREDGAWEDGASEEGPLEEREPADAHAVIAIVQAQSPAIQACYEALLAADETLRGRVEVSFTVQPSGRFELFEVESSNGATPALAACVADHLRNQTLERPAGGAPSRFAFPFVFAPQTNG